MQLPVSQPVNHATISKLDTMAPRRPHHDQYRSSRTSSRTHEQHGPASDHQRTRPGSPDPFHSDPGEDSDTDSYYAPGRDPRYWESEASDDDHIPVYDFELDNAFSKARPPRAPRVPRPAARSDGSQSQYRTASDDGEWRFDDRSFDQSSGRKGEDRNTRRERETCFRGGVYSRVPPSQRRDVGGGKYKRQTGTRSLFTVPSPGHTQRTTRYRPSQGRTGRRAGSRYPSRDGKGRLVEAKTYFCAVM